ncbi:MAG: SusD/RagB family nutrient-binding outer membrane lipoprotein, partial [Bacteroidota bacterium]
YAGSTALEGDILFGGDLSKWTAFAKSLKIKYLMRISARVDVGADLQELYDEHAFISSNADNASFDFTDTRPNNFRMANLRTGDFNLFIMSETMQEILNDLSDPREAVFFRPTQSDPTRFRGLLNGPDASQLSISVADYSLTGTIFRERTGALDASYMTAWETHFLLAEAAVRGLIDADAQALYEAGVALAFEYWQTELPDDYLRSGAAAFGESQSQQLEQILTQKWLANIINGYEGWIEYRRTGYPALRTIAASLNGDRIPARMPYPPDEEALNALNYNEAIGRLGGSNNINAKVWWAE